LACSDTRVNSNVASVDGTEDTVLEALGVFEIDIQLAVLAALRDGNAGTNGGNVLIEFQGKPRDVEMSAR
jgi:hypothetical protein